MRREERNSPFLFNNIFLSILTKSSEEGEGEGEEEGEGGGGERRTSPGK